MGDSNNMETRRVLFSTVEIIELPYTIGDNPSADGPPISASWEAQKCTKLKLEFFEQYRPPRRDKTALHLSKESRKNILLLNGHSEADIQHAANLARRVRQERYETIKEIRFKVKALLERKQNICTFSPAPSNQTTMKRSTPQLTPSPITSKKSSARCSVMQIRSRNLLPHLQFPSSPNGSSIGVLSPRRRKRAAPVELGDDLYSNESYDFPPTPYRISSKRPCSPRNSIKSEYSYSPPYSRDYPIIPTRFPAPRVRSPMVDNRPMIQPRRLSSPPPAVAYKYSPHRRVV